MRKISIVSSTVLMMCAAAAQASEPEPFCPTIKGKPRVYAIGSSTLGSTLGPMLRDQLAARGVAFKRWGKASSGLARPDFHDWPKTVPGIVRGFHPHVFVVSIGTNDGQNLFDDGRWFDFGSKRWNQIYRGRIDAMLNAMSGPKRRRAIVWIGPTALPGTKGSRRMRAVNKLMRERVEAFDGPIVYLDALARTSKKNGRIIDTFRRPGSKRPVKATGADGIHLTTDAVRFLLAEPVLDLLRPCLPGRAAKKRPRRGAPALKGS